jgi:hypothetical protein
MSTTYNCIYYWSPDHGRYIAARWCPKYLGGTAQSLPQLKQEIQAAGYYAVFGNTSIGPPDTPPTS